MELWKRRAWHGLAMACVVVLLPGAALAGMYTYTDDKGEVHFVDSLEKIPDDKLIEMERQGKIPPRGAVKAGAPAPVPTSVAEPGVAPAAAPLSSDPPPPPVDPYVPPPEPVPAPIEAPKQCQVSVDGEPTIEMKTHPTTARYSGTVQNTGTGIAKVVTVKLTLVSPLEARVLDTVRVNTIPLNIGPGQKGSFSVTGDYKKVGLFEQKLNRLEASYARCD